MRRCPRLTPGLVAALVAVATALPAAAEPVLRFVRPYTPQRLTWMPVDCVLDFDAAADETSLLVRLNGSDVTSAFTIGPPEGGRRRATAEALGNGLVVVGANELEAQVELAGVPQLASALFTASGDPFADEVVSLSIGTQGGFNSGTPALALGTPHGAGPFQGSTVHVLSLGLGGVIVVRFLDNRIVDGPGVDFTVFENAFLEIGAGLTQPPFAEPGRVSVSQDGVHWHAFDACPLVEAGAPYWPGCAGVYPVLSDGTSATPHASIPSDVPIEDLVEIPVLGFPLPAGAGGDSFDLAELGLAWASYVRVEAAGFTTGPVGTNNAGFDFDAVAAVNSAPPPLAPPAVPALGPGALGLLAALLALTALLCLGRARPAAAEPASAAPAPAAVDAAPPAPSVDERLAEIAHRIQRASRYPAIARERGVTGEALVAFEIQADGRPRGLALVSSSGSGALDRAALDAVERAAPLPFVYGRVTAPVRFTLAKDE